MVRKKRLELLRLAALEPKSSASTNFATSALGEVVIICEARLLLQVLIEKIIIKILWHEKNLKKLKAGNQLGKL